MKDPFDQFWEWANKPLDSYLTIPSEVRSCNGIERRRSAGTGIR
jgi:hypothetical protein